MFERFTEKAIKIIMLAQEEARRLGHNLVGTEFMLLGIIGEGTGIGAKSLKSLGINLKDARVEVEKIIGRGSGFTAVEIPFTPDAKRQIEFAWEEARKLGNSYIGTEHLLLGLLQVDHRTVGYRVLENLSINEDKIRSTVIQALGEHDQGSDRSAVARNKPTLFDDVEIAVNNALFEVIVSALPKKAQPHAFKLREAMVNTEIARDMRFGVNLDICVGQEKKLLEELSALVQESTNK